MSSRDDIFKAWVELVDESPDANITVNDIVERATVSRATFYRNFQSVYDLALEYYASSLRELILDERRGKYLYIMEDVFRLVEENCSLFKKLVKDPEFRRRIRKYSYNAYRSFYKCVDENAEPDPVELGYVTDGNVGVLFECMEGTIEGPPEEIASRLYNLYPETLKRAMSSDDYLAIREIGLANEE